MTGVTEARFVMMVDVNRAAAALDATVPIWIALLPLLLLLLDRTLRPPAPAVFWRVDAASPNLTIIFSFLLWLRRAGSKLNVLNY